MTEHKPGQLPTEPGYYWFNWGEGYETLLEEWQVVQVDADKTEPRGLTVWFIASEVDEQFDAKTEEGRRLLDPRNWGPKIEQYVAEKETSA